MSSIKLYLYHHSMRNFTLLERYLFIHTCSFYLVSVVSGLTGGVLIGRAAANAAVSSE